MSNQLELFAYGEALDLTEAHFLTLDVLYHRWRSTDPRFWEDTARESGSQAHARAMKKGMSEWYPIEKLPADALHDLAQRGWIELGTHDYWLMEKADCARLTNAGLDAWKRHEHACFEAGLKEFHRAKGQR